MDKIPVQARVDSALNAAIDNGYDLSASSDLDLVADLAAFCSDLEDVDGESLLDAIVDWRMRHPFS